MKLRRMVAVVVVGMACVAGASACATPNTPDFPKVVSLGKGELFPTIVNSGLAIGENRVLISITDRDDNRVLDAFVRLRYYNLNGTTPKFRSEVSARFIPVELSYVDEQSNRTRAVSGNDGVYVSNVDFEEAGDWGVEITITRGDRTLKPPTFRFNVLERSTEPAIGDAAPASVQQTLSTAPSIDEIDSSFPARPSMHNITVAEALGTGKPLVIAFATPAFCRSRTCGPVMDNVMDPLAASYGNRALFIHIEPYVLRDLRQDNIQNVVRAMTEWRLSTEPWVFVVDGHGRIVGKFEGIMAADEVESVLSLALEAPPAAVTPAPTRN